MSETRIEIIGDQIAARESYVGLHGMEAVYRYLVDKYNWLPEQARNIKDDDLRILLAGYEDKATTDWN